MQLPDVMVGAIVTGAYSTWVAAAIAVGLGVSATVALHRLRGTTLVAAAVWAIVAALGLAAVETVAAVRAGESDSLGLSLWFYTSAVGTFCPVMAVLGAKRPQDRGWQWIVLSLWVVLLVPAAQAVAGRSAQQLEVFTAWRLLLWVLIGMSLLNYLPTRHAAGAVFYSIGQSLLLWPYLWGIEPSARLRLAGVSCLLIAAAIAHYAHAPQGQKERPTSPLEKFNHRWAAFRDGWGAFWGLRVLQRVNQTAELSGWPVRLEWWSGFTPLGGTDLLEVSEHTVEQVKQTLDSLLRRFERLEVSRIER